MLESFMLNLYQGAQNQPCLKENINVAELTTLKTMNI